jgi:polysaccharide biosynthesis transport protein
MTEPEGGRQPACQGYANAPSTESSSEPGAAGLMDFLHVLRRNRGLLFLFALGGAMAAVLLSMAQTPVYQAKAVLELLDVNENVLNTRDLEPTSRLADSSPDYAIQTPVRILQSESLTARVLTKMRTEIPASTSAAAGQSATWRGALGLKQPVADGDSLVQPTLKNLRVAALPRTRLVEMRYDSADPQFAATFLNSLAQEFISQSIEVRWQASQNTGDWLARQLQDLKIRLEKSEDELQTYARTTGLVFTGETNNIAEDKLKQVQQALADAYADRTAKESQYELARISPPDALPLILDDKTLASYQEKLTDLRRQQAELSSALTPAHYKVKQVEAQIEAVDAAFNQQRGVVLARIRNEFWVTQRRERLLGADFAAQSKLVSEQAARSVHYNMLKREVDTHRQLYDGMLQKVKEYGIASAMHASNVRVVDAAKAPRLPYRPSYTANSVVGLLSGVFLGVILVLVRERVDRSIQSPGDAPFYLGAPELGVIPMAGSRRARGYYRARRDDGPEQQSIVELVTAGRSPAMLAEAFRTTIASILFGSKDGGPKVIVVTGTNPGVGKTTVTSNLGLALAELNRRVLLVDGDLRKPRLHQIFGAPNTWGLSDLLQGKPSPDAEVGMPFETGHPGLWLLPAGSATGSPSTLLHSALLPEMVQRFREDFDAILFDTPPMLNIPDARVLGRVADGIILVIRSRNTTRDMARAAVHRIAEDGSTIIGTILNGWDPSSARSGYYGAYRGQAKSYGPTRG